MTFDRGASLTTATTLGFSEAADLGPTAGNGFHTSWPDDLAALSELGLTALRIPLDWARLQPKPGDLDGDWAEWFDDVLTAVDAIGLRAWVTLHETAIPRWFDNDGGMDDAETFTKWWPRWVERAADRFGDRVDGWIPFAVMPPAISPTKPWPMQPWRDTWGILGGAGAPVVASVDASPASLDTFQYVERYWASPTGSASTLPGCSATCARPRRPTAEAPIRSPNEAPRPSAVPSGRWPSGRVPRR